MYAFVEAWVRGPAERRRWLLAMWLCWGLAFMTKGPPGLLPLAAMVAFLAIHDRNRLRGVFLPAGLLLFAVTAFTWFGFIVYQQPDRLGYFLGHEVVDRVFTATHDRNAQWYGGFRIYLPVLLLGALPWSVMAVAAAGGPAAAWRKLQARVRERHRETLLLLYWFLLPLTVFFLARSRLELYVLPLFVPLALIIARPLATGPGWTGRRLAISAAATAIALLALKGVAAHVTTDRDARRMADQITQVVDLHGIDEIAFFDMRAFFGLTLYLDVRVESVRMDEPGHAHSRFLPSAELLCHELSEQEASVFALKRGDVGHFRSAVSVCGPYQAVEIGGFHGDGLDIVLFQIPLRRRQRSAEDTGTPRPQSALRMRVCVSFCGHRLGQANLCPRFIRGGPSSCNV
jgi:hypothetical protein